MSTLKRREEAYSGSLTGIQQSPQELEQAVYDKSKTRVSVHNVPVCPRLLLIAFSAVLVSTCTTHQFVALIHWYYYMPPENPGGRGQGHATPYERTYTQHTLY